MLTFLISTDSLYRPIILKKISYFSLVFLFVLTVPPVLRVFENTCRVLRRIFGPKRDEVTGDWRKLHYEELNDLYSRNIIRVIKSRRIRWASHVARMGRGEAYTGFWLEA
jgi:hypothetical protein